MGKPLKTLNQLDLINGNIDEKQKRLRRVQQPIESQDAVNKAFADATYVAI